MYIVLWAKCSDDYMYDIDKDVYMQNHSLKKWKKSRYWISTISLLVSRDIRPIQSLLAKIGSPCSVVH